MKKGSFKSLLLSEYYLNKKTIVFGFIFFLMITLVVFLEGLSLKIGNLALMPEEVKKEFEESFVVQCYLPVAFAALIPSFTTNSLLENKNQRKFRLSTPVGHVRFAMAQYAGILILIAISLFLVSVYYVITDVFAGVNIDYSFVAVSMFFYMCMIVYGQCTNLLTMFFGSADKAGLCITGLTIAGFVAFFSQFEVGEEVVIDWSFTEELLAYIPVIIAAVLLAGFWLTVMLYKRRVK